MDYWCADFETIIGKEKTAVWAWDCRKVGRPGHHTGCDMGSFIAFIAKKQGSSVYFHNLKFDGEFLISHLLKEGYEHTLGRKLKAGQFSTLISDTGVFYQIRVMFQGAQKSVTFLDSLKLITLPIEKIPKAFGLAGVSKGRIDYSAHTVAGAALTEEEEDYIHEDTEIQAQAMEIFHARGLKKMTAASCAMNEYKELIGKRQFDRWFPSDLESDALVRRGYFGGWVYANPKFSGKVHGEGRVYDVNSHFPAQLRYQKLPYGKPRHFEGKYAENKFYPLYVQRLRFECELKEGKLPTIRGKAMWGNMAEMLTGTDGRQLEMCLTNIDLEMLFSHYHVWNIEYLEGYMFRAQEGMFDAYIEKWMWEKEDAARSGNKGMKQIAKLFLNSLYGKFGRNPNGNLKVPYLKDDGSVGYKLQVMDLLPPVYVALAAFVTAYARRITIGAAQANYARFLYADTDSIHLLGKGEPEGLLIHPTKLGYWDNEYNFRRCIYLHAKCYIDEVEIDGKPDLIVKCAGMTEKQKAEVTIDNFRPGLSIPGKLRPKHVPGGIVLEETTFEIRKGKA